MNGSSTRSPPEASFLERLTASLGAAAIRTSGVDQAKYLSDWRKRHHGRALAVVLPRNAQEVSAVLALCNEYSVPVFPQGGNTSMCGGSVPSGDGRGIVLGLERLSRIREVNAANNSITVEAGCVLATIQDAAKAADRYFPLSLGAEGSCQIGGNIATNAGGTSVVRYGNTRDLVLGLEVVLPDGRVWSGLRTLRKNNSGYDLKNLFVGSEGTLGVVTAATLKLFPLAPTTVTAMFSLDGIDEAVAFGSRLQEYFPGELVALELMSLSQLDIVLRHISGSACPLGNKGKWQLIVELASTAPQESLVEELHAKVGEFVDSGVVLDAVIASTESQRAKIWHLRHHVSEANVREGTGLTHDIAVPVYRIPGFVKAAEAMLARDYPGVQVVIVGHLGDGNLHYNAMHSHECWHETADKAAYQKRLAHALYDIAIPMDGTFSAEHGIGSLHLLDMAKYKDPVELALMRKIKQMLDPKDIMNPGRVLPPRV